MAAEGRKLDTQFSFPFFFFGQFYHIEINFVLTRGDMKPATNLHKLNSAKTEKYLRNKTVKAYGLFSKVETNNCTDTILIEIVSLCQRNNLRNEVLREGKMLMSVTSLK